MKTKLILCALLCLFTSATYGQQGYRNGPPPGYGGGYRMPLNCPPQGYGRPPQQPRFDLGRCIVSFFGRLVGPPSPRPIQYNQGYGQQGYRGPLQGYGGGYLSPNPPPQGYGRPAPQQPRLVMVRRTTMVKKSSSHSSSSSHRSSGSGSNQGGYRPQPSGPSRGGGYDTRAVIPLDDLPLR